MIPVSRETELPTEDEDLESRIWARAYLLWEQEGRPEGRDLEFWHRARRSIEKAESEATVEAALWCRADVLLQLRERRRLDGD